MADRRLCNFFNSPGGCRHGQSCKFLHAREADARARGGQRKEAARHKDGAHRDDSGGLQLFAHKASPAQMQDFDQLNPGQVAGWLKRTFKLSPQLYLDIRRSESTFQITIDASLATNILADPRKLSFNGIPVRVMPWRGKPQQL